MSDKANNVKRLSDSLGTASPEPRTRPVVELAHPSYHPTKAELEEQIEFPEGTMVEDLARALMQPVEVQYVYPRRRVMPQFEFCAPWNGRAYAPGTPGGMSNRDTARRRR